MNPHGFPFRMTVGKMIKLLAGKVCSPVRSRISLLTECAGGGCSVVLWNTTLRSEDRMYVERVGIWA